MSMGDSCELRKSVRDYICFRRLRRGLLLDPPASYAE